MCLEKTQKSFFVAISIFIVVFFSATTYVAAGNPVSPIEPADNIQDPGDPGTAWGGCGPSDSNCYITVTGGISDGDKGDITVSGSGSVWSIDANAITLGTDTTGDYVASFTAGAGLTGSASGEGSTPTLAVVSNNGGIVVNADNIALTLATSADALSATTSSGSGLEILSSGIALLQGCSDGQILKWNETSDVWACGSDATGGGAGNSFETLATPAGTNPVADNSTDTLTLAVTGTNLTITGDSTADTVTFDISEATLAGAGVVANGSALDIQVGNGIQISSDSVALGVLGSSWLQTGAFDIVLGNASSELQILESAGATFYGTFDVGDLSADATYTFSGTSGTVLTTANYTNTLDSVYVNVGESPAAGDITGSFSGGLTVGANSVALGTDTTGDYVASFTAGAGLTGSASGEGSTPTLAVVSNNGGIVVNADNITLTLASSADALSATTSSGSGLEILSSGITLLQGCSDGQILKWNETSDVWACGSDATGGGGLSDADYGDIVVSGSGTSWAIDADVIDWADIADATTLDASTSIAFGASTFNLTFTNNGSGNEIHNLSSTGDFVIQDNGVGALTVNDSGATTLGTSGSLSGVLNIAGATSGTVTIQPQAAAGTYNFNLPTTAGTSGYVLTSAGGGSSPMTWTNPASFTPSLTSTQIAFGNGSNVMTSSSKLVFNDALYPTMAITGNDPLIYIGASGTLTNNPAFGSGSGAAIYGGATYKSINFYDQISGGAMLARFYSGSGTLYNELKGLVVASTLSIPSNFQGAYTIQRTYPYAVTGNNGHGYTDQTIFQTGAAAFNSFGSFVEFGNSASSQDHYAAFQNVWKKSGTNNMSKVYGFVNAVSEITGGTITDLYGYYHYSPTMTSGTITNQYAVYIPAVTGATNNWSIYSVSTPSYHGGEFRIGSATDGGSYNLQVTGGTLTDSLTISGISGSTQCIQANSSGVLSGTGSACGSGGSTTWDTIGDPAGNGSIAMGATVQTMDWATATTQKALTLTANGLSSGALLTLSSNSTAATGNSQTLFNIDLSGANATASQSTYAAFITNTHTGTNSVNYGLSVTASDGSYNNALVATSSGSAGTLGNTAAKFINGGAGSNYDPVIVLSNTETTGYTQFSMEGTGNTWSFGVGNATEGTGLANNFFIYDYTNTSVRLVIDTNGYVGIGDLLPDYLLDVANAGADTNIFALTDSDGECLYNPESGSVTVSCSSDERLKENIVDAPSVLEYFKSFRVREYSVIASGDMLTGVIAQEVMQLHPDLVTLGANGLYSVELPNQWKVVKAIQELDANIESIKNLVDEPGGFLDNIRAWLADAANGIGDIVGGRLRAKDEICVGVTCITEGQLQELMQQAGMFQQASTSYAPQEDTTQEEVPSDSTPQSEPTDEIANEVTPDISPSEQSADEPSGEATTSDSSSESQTETQ